MEYTVVAEVTVTVYVGVVVLQGLVECSDDSPEVTYTVVGRGSMTIVMAVLVGQSGGTCGDHSACSKDRPGRFLHWRLSL